MKKLYALLVGINKYQKPVAPLKGCVQDVLKIQSYLKDYHGDQFELNIKTLLDEEATYDNLIQGFKSHLGNASSDDIVWFHFSGHGSEEKTAKEFLSIEANGKDQTLLCVDSLPDQSYNIADKELAVLLHNLSHSFPDGTKKESPPHIVVSLDCCHSGSGTRDAGQSEEIRVRTAVPSNRDRNIESYIDGYYAAQGHTLQVPTCPHVLLSACQSTEYAGDLREGGAFTTGLINALKKSKGNINYTDLFIRARASVKNIRKNQTPFFSSLQNFNPYSKFLEGSDFGEPDFFEVFFDNGNWYAKCGAIHGLPTDPNTKIEIDIYAFPKKRLKGSAVINSVGAQQSILDLGLKFQLKSTIDDILPGEDHYKGVIKSFPIPPESVYLYGTDSSMNAVMENAPENHYFNFVKASSAEHFLEVEVDQSFKVKDLRKDKIVHETSDPEELYTVLHRIIKWYRFLNLENKNSKIKNKVDFLLNVHDTKGQVHTHNTKEVKLYASAENSMGGKFGFSPKAKLHDAGQNLHFYLMYLRENYAIECPDEEVNFLTSEHEDSTLELPLWKEIKGFGPSQDQNAVTSNFKLVVTTEPLDFFQFLQTGLGATRSELSSWNPSKISNDWAVYDIAVTICKQEQKIGTDRPVSFNDGALKILPHPFLTADLSLSKEDLQTRNSTSFGNATLIEQDQFQLINLNNSRSHEASNILELNNISLSDYNALKETPLELQLEMDCAENELIFPLAFDGKYYRIAGEGIANEEGTKITINQLPEPAEIQANLGDEMGTRSAFGAIKLAFYKMVLKKEIPNTLNLIEKVDGRFINTKENFAIKIMGAKKVLIVIHGIFGDARSTVEQLATLNAESFDQYDCILGYDYDCLSVPLDQNAKHLKKDLMDLNLHTHKDKTIDIVAHSCGGLIARWLIEQEGGKAYINQLTMLATPNAGSLYGKIESYRSFSLQMLELAANFIPKMVPGIGLAIKVLKFAGNLTPSLAQMSPDSDFLNKLNTSQDPEIPYSNVAAVSTGKEEDSSSLKAMQKLFNSKMKEINHELEHDLFVKPESVYLDPIFNNRSQPATQQNKISGHHFSFLAEVKI